VNVRQALLKDCRFDTLVEATAQGASYVVTVTHVPSGLKGAAGAASQFDARDRAIDELVQQDNGSWPNVFRAGSTIAELSYRLGTITK